MPASRCHAKPYPAKFLGLVLALVLLTTPGCLVRARIIRHAGTGSPNRKLQTASKDDLVRRVRNEYNAIRSFNATVDLTPAVGSVYKGSITEYKDVRAYVLLRKPSDIRIVGLYPVVRSKAFDMVSNGNTFRIYIPSKNRFVVGENDAPPTAKSNLENLRPRAFLDAMLIPPPDEKVETTVLEDATDEENALYILHLLRKTPQGQWILNRNIWVDRISLHVVRQKTFDPNGGILSDTRYQNWKSFGGVSFPVGIDINRDEDGYGVTMNVVKLDMNAKLSDERFVLPQPEGTQLQTIGKSQEHAAVNDATTREAER